MIKNIETIENLGIYENYKRNNTINNFMQYNLFYGWNGGGKSTLSKLFRSLETKEINEDFPKMKFSMRLVDDSQITEKDFIDLNKKVFVFNQEFIDENINWDSKLNSILLLSEEKIKEMKEYDNIKELLFGNKDNGALGLILSYENKLATLQKNKSNLDNELSNVAKNIKNSFTLINVNDRRLINYNRTKVSDYIENMRGCIIDKSGILSKELLLTTKNISNPYKKEIILNEIKLINYKKYELFQKEFHEIIGQTITSRVIQELEDDLELSNWIEDGYKLHIKKGAKDCLFCGSDITSDRMQSIDGHFSNSFLDYKRDISKLKDNLKELIIDENDIILDENLFYTENSNNCRKTNKIIKELIKQFNEELKGILNILIDKESNPFNKVLFKELSINDTVSSINEKIGFLNHLIKLNNEKTQNFEKNIKDANEKLELHFMTEQLQDIDYYNKKDEISNLNEEIEKLGIEIGIYKETLSRLEAVLSNEALGAEKFNEKLHAFLGHNELTLEFDSQLKGYKILRAPKNIEAKNLSEGEKGSVAFVYFMIKLKENGNKISDSIIVIDDPISSFDSNKVFHAYSFLKYECDNPKQIFVMTHNYNFYTLVLGWFNKMKYKEDGKFISNFGIYKIEPDFEDGVRIGNIKNGNKCLTQGSEYDYIFYNVYRMRDKELTDTEMLYCGNITRKLVESFLSFKFPKQRGNLKALLSKAFKEKEDYIKIDTIYRFTNIYSHHKKIDVYGSSSSEIISLNVNSVINIVLEMMEDLDKNHYDAMINWADDEIVSNG